MLNPYKHIKRKEFTKEEEVNLIKRHQRGDKKATEILVENNLGLVIWTATRRFQHPTLDLVSSGMLGLVKALDKFDISKDTRLSTYATHWIIQAMFTDISDTITTTRLPVHFLEIMRIFKKVEQKLFEGGNTQPLDKDIILAFCEYTGDKVKTATEKLVTIRNLSSNSPNTKQYSSDESSFDCINDAIADPNGIEDRINKKIESESILDILKSVLDEREMLIMKMRYGLGGMPKFTLNQIAQEIVDTTGSRTITRERVRQIQENIEEKIRRAGKAKFLLS